MHLVNEYESLQLRYVSAYWFDTQKIFVSRRGSKTSILDQVEHANG